ncbi:MAG: threonine ammonia-lyase, biosynthetic [Gammaproteobacteria bacterium]|jgi:threonine dehydratase|nr:threonine ammonia-lyase, biosynthetic [Gammaproteobacteria bacterium]MBT4462220.1 threonine ammonia-lyase, biosynthetic [Gammaproteobacteria bacterium]MBT4654466.1 threonine ammonia-lyase, biosynthetic [Gammaproteobacteria bacterium]MBT5117381.1 threonine ammonia-lyase, biosynthetic [Gammaproteobacteria bacterium]MBT5761964.1 threonine ammonia-lyase, biosynthetic [Gammaproteobacteria bacterium]
MTEKKLKLVYKKIKNSNVYDIALKTPLDYAKTLSKRLGNNIYIKRDDLQPVFSFKLRGAYNKISHLKKTKNISYLIAASAGNHAQGVALSSKKLGIKAIIVMPKTTPMIKVNAVKSLGAQVILEGDSYDDAYDFAIQKSKNESLEFIHPYDDLDVIAGQGTIALEIMDQLQGKPDYIFVPVGGGGLLAGIVSYLKYESPKTKIIAVEPVDSNCFNQAFTMKKRVKLKSIGIFADGVAVKQIGKHTFDLTKDEVFSSVLVNTDEICAGIKDLYEETRTIAEPAGALSIAGIKKFVKLHNIKNKKLISIFCGANMNFDRLRHVSERSELGELNEMLIGVTIQEQPGSFKKFCSLLGKRSITEFNYRYSDDSKAHVFAGIKLNNGMDDKKKILSTLKSNKYKVIDFTDNEMAKLHIRYMVGGISKNIKNEKVFRFIFPEKPGELLNFLNAIGSKWNISLFHYRNHGADFGRVLLGIQIEQDEIKTLLEHLNTLKYEFFEETYNKAYNLFLS